MEAKKNQLKTGKSKQFELQSFKAKLNYQMVSGWHNKIFDYVHFLIYFWFVLVYSEDRYNKLLLMRR